MWKRLGLNHLLAGCLCFFSFCSILILLCSCVALGPTSANFVGSVHGRGIAYIATVIGAGRVYLNGHQVVQGTYIGNGDKVATGPSTKVRIVFSRGDILYLDENTDPELSTWIEQGILRIRAMLYYGQAALDSRGNAELRTASGAKVEPLGTMLNLKVTSAATITTVVRGAIRLTGAVGNPIMVQAGYQSVVSAGRPPTSPHRVPLSPIIDWIQPLKQAQSTVRTPSGNIDFRFDFKITPGSRHRASPPRRQDMNGQVPGDQNGQEPPPCDGGGTRGTDYDYPPQETRPKATPFYLR
jgi:hypothetical protein